MSVPLFSPLPSTPAPDAQVLSFVVVVQSLSCVQLLATPWAAARQASLSFTISQSLLKLMPLRPVMLSKHLILYCPFFCLQSYPASGSFPKSQLFKCLMPLLSNPCPDHVCITLSLPCAPRMSQRCQTTLNQAKSYCCSQMDTR